LPTIMNKLERLDKLHLEYEALLIKEIESMIGLAFSHGWRSRNHEEGKRLRSELRKAGSKIADEQS